MGKQSGGTRSYSHRDGTMAKRRSEYESLLESGGYDQERSVFDKSGGFVLVHKYHNEVIDAELDKSDIAALLLAKKGYKVYLDDERSYIEGQPTKDGHIYKEPMDIKTINDAGNYTIKNSIEHASAQNASIVILYQNTGKMTRAYVESQIDLFKEKSPKKARDKIKEVIVVGMSGRVHRHKLK